MKDSTKSKYDLLLQLKIEIPPPVKEIHSSCCAHCPSAGGVVDEEDFESRYYQEEASRQEQIDSVFRCAWRPQKACKGWCDIMQVTEADLEGRTHG